MNTRRKFLLSGSMATAALLTAKPFTSIANSLSPVTGYRFNTNSLVLAHTGNSHAVAESTLEQISRLKKSGSNVIMLHAGDRTPALPGQLAYDASMHSGENFSVSAGDYKIINKGDVKTGVITANDASVTVDSINTLAAFLKKEKNCQLVVCLSQLGYKTSTGLNDLELAAASTHIDVIIGGHADNYCTRPVIARNKNKEEVIINHAAASNLAIRKVEIGFDSRGRKSQVSLTKICKTA